MSKVKKIELIKDNMKPTKGLKNGSRKSAARPAADETAAPIISKMIETTAPTTGTQNGHGGKTITIEAKIDVGYGNTLYMRGEGEGLSWNQGVPLSCVDSATWTWSGEAHETLKFKLLLNDSVWAHGEDIVATPGEKVEVTPEF